MAREVISISIGQGGIQYGNAVWAKYCEEHKIAPNGKPRSDYDPENRQLLSFFEEQGEQGAEDYKFVPRQVTVDLDPTVVDEMRKGAYKDLFNPEFLLSGTQDAGNIYARGHYSTQGKESTAAAGELIRKVMDNSENVQGFIINHSLGGGTGSGLGTLVLENLAVNYHKKTRVGFEIYSSPNLAPPLAYGPPLLDAYNGLLASHWLLDHTDVSLVLDNEALYAMLKRDLKVESPTYSNINRIMAKAVSSMTASLRFGGELNATLDELKENTVQIPRLHFLTSSMAPILRLQGSKSSAQEIILSTEYAFDPASFLVKYADFDVAEDKYMSIALCYRGVSSKEAGQAAEWITDNNKASLVDWCATNIKIGLNDKIDDSPGNVVMLGNNLAMSRFFNERMLAKYDVMYAHRAYVQWYTREGMEEGEFSEAREDLGFLERDYLGVLEEHADEEEDEDEF